MTFELRTEGDEGASHVDIWEESSPGTGDSKCSSQDLLGIFVAGAEGVRERVAEAKSERGQKPRSARVRGAL